jgi:pimeloyl-ACP methyl ester carboxylesterase
LKYFKVCMVRRDMNCDPQQDATTFLYLHGFASGPSSKKAQAFRESFENLGWEIVIPDLNPSEFRFLTVGGMLQTVERLAAGVTGDLVLLGSSLGGYLATLLSTRLSGLKAVIAMAPAFDVQARWRENLGLEALKQWKVRGSISVYHHGFQEERLLDYEFFQEVGMYPPFPEIEDTPVLIFQGRRDEVVPLDAVEAFARERKTVRLRVFDDDHSLHDSISSIVGESIEFLQLLKEGSPSQEVSRG